MSNTHSPKRKTSDSAIPIQIKMNEKQKPKSGAKGAARYAHAQPVLEDRKIDFPKLPLANASKFQKVELLSNSFELNVERQVNIYRYTVDVNIILEADEGRGKKVVQLNGRGREAKKHRREEMNALMHDVLLKQNLLTVEDALVYDGDQCLFTNRDLLTGGEEHSFYTKASDLSPTARAVILTERVNEVEITIKQFTESANRFTINEAFALIKNDGTDRPLRQFLELLTTQPCVNNGSFLVMGGGRFCSKKSAGRIRIYDRRNAVLKGTSIVDNKGSLQAQLTVDARTMTCFPSSSLLDLAMSLNSWSKIPQKWRADEIGVVSRFIQGRQVQLMDRPNQRFEAYCLVDKEFRMCVDEYMDHETKTLSRHSSAEKFNGKLRYPDAPCVERRTQSRVQYFPIEILKLGDDQPVPLQVLREENIQPAPVKPNERFNRIREGMRNMGITGDSGDTASILGKFGVSIHTDPIRTVGFRRPAPGITYGDGAERFPNKDNANWPTRGTKYTKPASIDFLLFAGNNFSVAALTALAKDFTNTAAEKGMIIKKVKVSDQPLNLMAELKGETKVFKTINEMKCHPLIVYVDPKSQKTHGMLKLLERKFAVPTQHITAEVASRARSGSIMMENILAKTNCKCGGYNYKVDPEIVGRSGLSSNVLIVGVDVAHPPAQSAGARSLGLAPEYPSVVGFSSNCLADPHEFIGDFHFQEPKQEKIDPSVINDRMQWILQQFKKNRGQYPSTIYIFRDGISEGQYLMAITEELPAYRNALHKLDPSNKTEFVMIIATKRHHHRFFTQDPNRQLMNPLPLTIVDRDIVSREVSEFYCQSHQPLQGTAKSTAYQILYSDKKDLTHDNIQALILALCFEHQISASPISIPEPIYMADEYAKRGNNLFKAYRLANIPILRLGAPEDAENPRVPIDWEKMTQRLSYKGTKLAGTRLNA